MEQEFLGAIPDPRSEIEKAKDYSHEEMLGMGALNWEEKTDWEKLSQRNQNSPTEVSFSCGGHSGAKALEAFTGIPMSAHPQYRNRSNYPTGGMYPKEVAANLKDFGTTLEVEDISNFQGETVMNKDITVETPYKIGSYYQKFPLGIYFDIDLIATALEQGHAIILGIHSNRDEWKQYPVCNDQETTFSHFVTIVPKNYLLYKGQKAVVVDDSDTPSTTIDGKGQRILTNDFLKKRCWAVVAIMPRVLQSDRPKFTATHNMRPGYFGDDVKNLQECLAYIDYFPKTTAFTGFFGQITKKAVLKFQSANNLLPDAIVGEKTRAVLRSLFS